MNNDKDRRPKKRVLEQHCLICDHHVKDFKAGILCGLTRKKPNFQFQCPDAKFAGLMDEKVKAVNVKCYEIRGKKGDFIASLAFQIIIGFSILTGGYLFYEFLWQNGWIATVPFGMMFLGALLMARSVGIIRFYRQEKEMAEANKTELDTLLAAYKMSYDIEIVDGPHDTTEVRKLEYDTR